VRTRRYATKQAPHRAVAAQPGADRADALPKATRDRATALPSPVAETAPWILFHAPWTERAKSGMVLLERMQRFLAAAAVDPAPDSLEMTIYDRFAQPLPPLVQEAGAAFGASQRDPEAPKPGGLARWRWRREARNGAPIPPADIGALVDFYRTREHLPPVDGPGAKRAVLLHLTYWFEVKRPGTNAALFPSASLRSGLLLSLDSRHANLSIRYASPELTPELRTAHAAIVAALGPKTPRHAFQRIIPARTPGGRERREPL